MSTELYITRLCAWAPGAENSFEWDEWARGKRVISSDIKSPAIAFTDSLFRRRLSQITKMTVHVVHELLPVKDDTKMFFVSFRGELSRQYKVNKMLIEDKSLKPADFSLSVFNAPAAMTSIALGLKGGYSALYPGNNSFSAGLAAARASFSREEQSELVFIYADEQAPPEYERILETCPPPLAFAFLLSKESQPGGVPFSSLMPGEIDSPDCPLDFLRRALLCGKIHVPA